MTQMAWDAGQYLKFGEERTRPARDLLARVPLASPRRVVDLGCGPGNSTDLLIQRWPRAEVTGIDSSPDMLDRARLDHPRARWVEADIAAWHPEESFDLVFSNAALQWVPDHARVFPALFDTLSPGGVLAVQMPRNYDAPTHAILREMAAHPRWSPRMPAQQRGFPVSEPGVYYDLLAPRAAHLDIFEVEYLQVKDDAQGIVEWMKGTGLRPFLQDLDEALRAAFLADYLARLERAYPRRADGKALFPFRRLFLLASR